MEEDQHKKQTPKAEESADLSNDGMDSQTLVEQLQKDLEEAQRAQEDNVAKAQRALADYANLKKRFEKEREEIAKYASELVVMQLLPVIDNLDRAVFYANEVEQQSSLYHGVKMTLQQAHEALEGVGFGRVQAVAGQEFDPHLHEAVEMVAGEQGKVLEMVRPGYKLDDKMIRPVQVKVGNGEQESKR